MKQKGTIKFSGTDKRNGLVHVASQRGYYTRQQQAAGLHADDENIQVNCRAAESVNGLASSINNVLKLYCAGFCDRKIYFKMTSLFFQAEPASRLGRLMELADRDVHPRFTLNNAINLPKITVRAEGDKVLVQTKLTSHALMGKDQKFYSIEIILMLWNSDDKQYSHAHRYTKWLDPTVDKIANYTFKFDKPANSTEYLVMCCCLRNESRKANWAPSEKALKIMNAGSFDEKAMVELEAYRTAKKNEVLPTQGSKIERGENDGQEPDEE